MRSDIENQLALSEIQAHRVALDRAEALFRFAEDHHRSTEHHADDEVSSMQSQGTLGLLSLQSIAQEEVMQARMQVSLQEETLRRLSVERATRAASVQLALQDVAEQATATAERRCWAKCQANKANMRAARDADDAAARKTSTSD